MASSFQPDDQTSIADANVERLLTAASEDVGPDANFATNLETDSVGRGARTKRIAIAYEDGLNAGERSVSALADRADLGTFDRGTVRHGDVRHVTNAARADTDAPRWGRGLD